MLSLFLNEGLRGLLGPPYSRLDNDYHFCYANSVLQALASLPKLDLSPESDVLTVLLENLRRPDGKHYAVNELLEGAGTRKEMFFGRFCFRHGNIDESPNFFYALWDKYPSLRESFDFTELIDADADGKYAGVWADAERKYIGLKFVENPVHLYISGVFPANVCRWGVHNDTAEVLERFKLVGSDSNTTQDYQLYAVVCYKPGPPEIKNSTGHYWSCCLRDGKWYIFDDHLELGENNFISTCWEEKNFTGRTLLFYHITSV